MPIAGRSDPVRIVALVPYLDIGFLGRHHYFIRLKKLTGHTGLEHVACLDLCCKSSLLESPNPTKSLRQPEPVLCALSETDVYSPNLIKDLVDLFNLCKFFRQIHEIFTKSFKIFGA